MTSAQCFDLGAQVLLGLADGDFVDAVDVLLGLATPARLVSVALSKLVSIAWIAGKKRRAAANVAVEVWAVPLRASCDTRCRHWASPHPGHVSAWSDS